MFAVSSGPVVKWFLLQSVHLNLNLLLAPAIGYGMGEVISLAVNRKRGRGLIVIAGIALIISYIISIAASALLGSGLPIGLFNIIYDLIAIALGIFVAATRLR